MASTDHPRQPALSPSASSRLRRTAYASDDYTLEIGTRNTGSEALHRWQAIITMPTGAGMTADDDVVLDNEQFPQIYLLRPARSATIAPGSELVITVRVHGTNAAPVAAEVTVRTLAGDNLVATIDEISVTDGAETSVATDQAWPGAPALASLTAS